MPVEKKYKKQKYIYIIFVETYIFDLKKILQSTYKMPKSVLMLNKGILF